MALSNIGFGNIESGNPLLTGGKWFQVGHK